MMKLFYVFIILNFLRINTSDNKGDFQSHMNRGKKLWNASLSKIPYDINPENNKNNIQKIKKIIEKSKINKIHK